MPALLCANTTLCQHYFVPALLCADAICRQEPGIAAEYAPKNSLAFVTDHATQYLGPTLRLCQHDLVLTLLYANATFCRHNFVAALLGLTLLYADNTLSRHHFVDIIPYQHSFVTTLLCQHCCWEQLCANTTLANTTLCQQYFVPTLLCASTTLRQHDFVPTLFADTHSGIATEARGTFGGHDYL